MRRESNGARQPSLIVIAVFLAKLAKHAALLACLALVGQATGRVPVGELTILSLVVGAVLLHRCAAAVARRGKNCPALRFSP